MANSLVGVLGSMRYLRCHGHLRSNIHVRFRVQEMYSWGKYAPYLLIFNGRESESELKLNLCIFKNVPGAWSTGTRDVESAGALDVW